MTNKIKLTIQEITNDFYSLAETEGYYTGRAECYELSETDRKEYFEFVENMIKKYIPNYKKFVKKGYEKLDTHDKGFELSYILQKNFKEIFYQLID